jgi:two-component system OmpR family response regulator
METAPHIAIVDDHRDIRDLVGKYLSRHGYRTSLAESAAACRRLIDRHGIDLVVLDVMMPGEDGLSLCRFIRESTDVPVIMLTAMAEDTDRIVGLELGADDYLSKPFNPRELLARIKAVLRRVQSLPPQRGVIKAKEIRFDRWLLNVGRRELIDEYGGVPASERLSRSRRTCPQPRSAIGFDGRQGSRAVRSQHRQSGEPPAQEDRG